MRIVITNILTITMNPDNAIGSYTIVIEDEVIKSVTSEIPEKHHDDIVIPGSGKVALPGFINGHVHCDVALARGLGDGLSLYEQNCDSFVSEHRWFQDELDRESRHLSRILQCVEAVKGGTTFICDVPFWPAIDDIVTPFEQVGIDGAVVVDYRPDFLKGARFPWDEYAALCRHIREKGYLPIVEAPAEEDYDTELLQELAAWAEKLDTSIQMHLAETTYRMELVKQKYRKSSVQYLHDIGFLNSRVIGSHGVYLGEADRKLFRAAGAKIVNTPIAEMKIADGVAPVAEYLKEGIPVGLGSDGALWNDASDMFSEMKALLLVQRVRSGAGALSAYDALYAATLGGAKVFGIDDKYGSIEVNKQANIVLIDYLKPHLVPFYDGNVSNVVPVLVTCARASDVDTVIVNGRIVVENGQVLSISEKKIVEACQTLGKQKFGQLQIKKPKIT